MAGSTGFRALWLAIALIFGLLVGAAAGFAAFMHESSLSKSVLVGAAAMAGATVFALTMVQYMSGA